MSESTPHIAEPCATCGISGKKPKGAVCCRYITVKLMPPVDEEDWEEIRWWLAHDGTMVYANVLSSNRVEWHLQVDTRCGFLGARNVCGAYAVRPGPCREYSPRECEAVTGAEQHDIELRTMEDAERYADAALRLAQIAERIKNPGDEPEPHRVSAYSVDP